MPLPPQQSRKFLYLGLGFLGILLLAVILFIILRNRGGKVITPPSDTTIPNIEEKKDGGFFKSLFQPAEPFSEVINAELPSVSHGHDVGTDSQSHLFVSVSDLPTEGCNLFNLNIFDADCDGLPDWLEDELNTNTRNPDTPYRQGAWDYDEDEVFHGMDGHYACDIYPTLLNCELRNTSLNEIITKTQNTDEGCVPDIIEMVRGTDPLDPTDDHAPDYAGNLLTPIDRCDFTDTDTTISGTPLNEINPFDLTNNESQNLIPLGDGYAGGFSTGLTAQHNDFLNQINGVTTQINDTLDEAGAYTTQNDGTSINDGSYVTAQNQGQDQLINYSHFQSYLGNTNGYDTELWGSQNSTETFTIEANGQTLTHTCVAPGITTIPWDWGSADPAVPQTLSVTVSDQAGNVGETTVLTNLEIDPQELAIRIVKETPEAILNTDTVSYRVLSNQILQNVDASDFTISSSSSVTGEIQSVTQSGGTNYLVTIGNIEGEGIVRLSFDLGHDIIAGTDTQSVSSIRQHIVQHQSYIVDRVAPLPPAIYHPQTNATTTSPAHVAVSCPGRGYVVNVRDDASFTLDHSCEYPGIQFIPLGIFSGNTNLLVSLTDPAGNLGTASSVQNITVTPSEHVPVAILRSNNANPLSNATEVSFTLNFQDPVAGVDVNDWEAVATGTLSGEIQSLTQLSPVSYEVVVTTNEGDGFISLWPQQNHQITRTSDNQAFGGLNDIVERQAYQLDHTIGNPTPVLSPTLLGTISDPTGIVVECHGGESSTLHYQPQDIVYTELNEYITYGYVWNTYFQDYLFFVPQIEYITRDNVKFTIDMRRSYWQNGRAVIFGTVDTNGLTLTPQMRWRNVDSGIFSSITREDYLDQCRAAQEGYAQQNIEDGEGLLFDLGIALFTGNQYDSAPIYARVPDAQTGQLQFADTFATPPGVSVPFVTATDQDLQAPNQTREPLDPLGLYAFSFVDPSFSIPITIPLGTEDDPFDITIPGISGATPNNGALSSFTFFGPSCFDILNRFVPSLTVDLTTSFITEGTERGQSGNQTLLQLEYALPADAQQSALAFQQLLQQAAANPGDTLIINSQGQALASPSNVTATSLAELPSNAPYIDQIARGLNQIGALRIDISAQEARIYGPNTPLEGIPIDLTDTVFGPLAEGYAEVRGSFTYTEQYRLDPFNPTTTGDQLTEADLYMIYGPQLQKLNDPGFTFTNNTFSFVVADAYRDDSFAIYDKGTNTLVAGPHKFGVLQGSEGNISQLSERWYYLRNADGKYLITHESGDYIPTLRFNDLPVCEVVREEIFCEPGESEVVMVSNASGTRIVLNEYSTASGLLGPAFESCNNDLAKLSCIAPDEELVPSRLFEPWHYRAFQQDGSILGGQRTLQLFETQSQCELFETLYEESVQQFQNADPGSCISGQDMCKQRGSEELGIPADQVICYSTEVPNARLIIDTPEPVNQLPASPETGKSYVSPTNIILAGTLENYQTEQVAKGQLLIEVIEVPRNDEVLPEPTLDIPVSSDLPWSNYQAFSQLTTDAITQAWCQDCVVQVLASPNTSTSQGIFITLPTDTLDAPGTVSIDMSQLFNGRALKEDHLYFYRVSDPFYASLYQDDPLDIFIPNENYFNTHLGHVLGQGWVSLYGADDSSILAHVAKYDLENGNLGLIDQIQADNERLNFGGTISIPDGAFNPDDLNINANIDTDLALVDDGALVQCGRRGSERYVFITRHTDAAGEVSRKWNFDSNGNYFAGANACEDAKAAFQSDGANAGVEIIGCFEKNMCNYHDLVQQISRWIRFIILLTGPIAAMSFAYAGWLFIRSQGNADKRGLAKKIFLNTFIGIVIILLAWISVATFFRLIGLDESYSLLNLR